jgi:hypothetical protein
MYEHHLLMTLTPRNRRETEREYYARVAEERREERRRELRSRLLRAAGLRRAGKS